MKKNFTGIILIISLFCCLALLGACENPENPDAASDGSVSSAETSAGDPGNGHDCNDLPDVPKGYTLYLDEYLAFAYPSDWKPIEEGDETYLFSEDKMHSVSVTYTARTEKYETLSEEDFLREMEEALGVRFDECTIEQLSKDGFPITKIYYRLNLFEEKTTIGTQYYVSSGDRTYCIHITQTDSVVEGLAEVVYDTLTVLH